MLKTYLLIMESYHQNLRSNMVGPQQSEFVRVHGNERQHIVQIAIEQITTSGSVDMPLHYMDSNREPGIMNLQPYLQLQVVVLH
jgi:hypothetical protein